MGRTFRWVLIVAAGLGAVACAHSQAPKRVEAGTPPATVPEDPTAQLIAKADVHLATGRNESRAGHLRAAREEFNQALDIYLTAPGGAFGNPRLAEAYRRTLESIQLAELEALAAGDGFTEVPAEPASIDEMADLSLGESTPSEEDRQIAQDVISTESNDLPITLNDQVLSCIDLYQGRLRDWFAEALARGGRYLPHIRETFATAGIPQDLAYVGLVESAFRTAALSRAKAKGVWQFIPSTGRRFGLKQDWWVDERSDPERSTRAAAQYFKNLYEMFGDWNLALAAYNAGEGKVMRGVNRHGTTDFWELARSRALPRETRNYVPMIHAAIIVAKAPETYGFSVTPEEALASDGVPIAGAVDLRLIAECAGAEVEEIQRLNPQLRRLATPAHRTFDLRVPVGSGDTILECLERTPPESRVSFRTHVVSRGETLAALSRRYGTPARAIADANGIRSLKRLRRGMELIIPIAPRDVLTAAGPTPSDASASSKRTASLSPTVRVSYRVRPGDTLSRIASRYRTTVQDLKAWNRSIRGTSIAAGDMLTVYTRKN
jgi:membrane-bound lytic murein transglycosylase D